MQTSQTKNSGATHKLSTPQSKLLVIKRKFDVPVDRLFGAFTAPDALKVWWWPKGLHSDHIDLQFREGGKYFINMKGYDKGGGGMTGEFEEIVNNERIVMTDYFADERGNKISAEQAGMEGEWPKQAYITLEFEALDKDSSRFTMSQQGIPNESQKDCTQGWNESFDKLEAYLNDRKN